jgi:G3E family GTPase
LKRIARGIGGCSKNGGTAEHHHPHEIGTISVEVAGELDANRFCKWLEGFTVGNGSEVFRGKGILAIKGVPERMVFQGVHGIFRLTLGQSWADEKRLSQVVFIGRNLQREEISSALEGCKA